MEMRFCVNLHEFSVIASDINLHFCYSINSTKKTDAWCFFRFDSGCSYYGKLWRDERWGLNKTFRTYGAGLSKKNYFFRSP